MKKELDSKRKFQKETLRTLKKQLIMKSKFCLETLVKEKILLLNEI